MHSWLERCKRRSRRAARPWGASPRGYHLGLPPEQEAIRMVQRALDHGMNFLDNCALCRARHNAHYADWRIMPTPMRSATERTERYAA